MSAIRELTEGSDSSNKSCSLFGVKNGEAKTSHSPSTSLLRSLVPSDDKKTDSGNTMVVGKKPTLPKFRIDESAVFDRMVQNNSHSMSVNKDSLVSEQPSSDEAKYAHALTQVNAQAVAKVLADLPTEGNEEQVYHIVRVMARDRIKKIIDNLPLEDRYRDARLMDPLDWINVIVKPKLEPEFHAALYDLFVYNTEEHKAFYKVLLNLRTRIAQLQKEQLQTSLQTQMPSTLDKIDKNFFVF